jgi:hypothetical protein
VPKQKQGFLLVKWTTVSDGRRLPIGHIDVNASGNSSGSRCQNREERVRIGQRVTVTDERSISIGLFYCLTL